MRVIIFSDKNNFDCCLNKINDLRRKGEKRFWRIESCYKFLFDKLKTILPKSFGDLNLVKTFIYTGEYNSKLLNKVERYCKKEIEEINKFIEKEESLLSEIADNKIEEKLKNKIKSHVGFVKGVFEDRKKKLLGMLEKQKRNAEGQKRFFERFDNVPLIEIKRTPLKHAQGMVYQKGVDVLIATDIVNLANINAYDIAFILGGDTDLIESIKLVRTLTKIVVITAYYDKENPLKSSISRDLIKEADFFINLKEDFKEEDILKISELRRLK